jgi:flagellin
VSLVINTNVGSLFARRNLAVATERTNNSLQLLASGQRINQARQDAAGLMISEMLRSSIRGLDRSLQNTQDGSSMLQIAEGSLSVIGNNLQRVRELTVQAANDTNGDAQRRAIEQEIQSLLKDNDRIAQSTKFNGQPLLDGSAGETRVQVGPGPVLQTDTIDVGDTLQDASSQALDVVGAGTNAGFSNIGDIQFTDGDSARAFLQDIDNAIASVSQRRSEIGSYQNRLESASQNISISFINTSAANSRIRDLNFASEASKLIQNQILQQTSVSVLMQANQTPGLAMRLLGSGGSRNGFF